MQQQSIDYLQRTLDDVFVSPVNRIASLERDHSSPAFLFESISRLFWVETVGWKRRIARPVQQAYRSAKEPLALLEKSSDTRMRLVGCQVDAFCFSLLVVTELLP